MELKCLADKCNYNKDLICQNACLYVNCFRLSQWEADNLIAEYFKKKSEENNDI